MAPSSVNRCTCNPFLRSTPAKWLQFSLAIEIHANYLLIDERDGRRAAIRENLAVIGTIGVLERAAITQLLDLPDTLRKLPPDFTARLDPALIKNALERDLIRKAKPAS